MTERERWIANYASAFLIDLGCVPTTPENLAQTRQFARDAMAFADAHREATTPTLREAIDKALREVASDMKNRWCKNAHIILTAAIAAQPRVLVDEERAVEDGPCGLPTLRMNRYISASKVGDIVRVIVVKA